MAFLFGGIGLLVGALLAWVWQGRKNTGLIQQTTRLEAECKSATAQLADVKTQLTNRETELAEANKNCAVLETRLSEQTQWKALIEEQWQQQFEAFLLKTVGQSREQFEEHLQKTGKEKDDLFYKKMEETIKPLSETLEKFGKQNIELSERVRMLSQTSQQVVSSLSYNKGRGDWGEVELIRLLEDSGLTEGTGYARQKTLPDGKRRPDIRINLPDSRVIFVDAKAIQIDLSEDAPTEVTAETEQLKKERYARSMKEAVKTLTTREYQAQIIDSADFVVLYVPREGMLAYALESDPNLFKWAYDQKVILAGPLNLMAMLRVVHHSWVMAKLSEDASKILTLGTRLQKQAVVFTEKFGTLGKDLGRALKSYQDTRTSFEGQQGFTRQIRKLEEYGCQSGKPMEEPVDLRTLATDVVTIEG